MRPLVPVILTGGVGSRLWPESRQQQPKQLLRLLGPSSLLQMTAERIARLPQAGPAVIVCGEALQTTIRGQLSEIDQRARLFVLEPFVRSTAPAAAAAALALDPDDLMLILPADHLVADVAAFADAVAIATELAAADRLVSFGITPRRAATGYGYIQHGEPIGATAGAFHVHRFVEKPDRRTAESYVEAGTYSWNSGMFLFRASTYLEELEAHRPDIVHAVSEAVTGAGTNDDTLRLGRDAFAECPTDSIDYGVMEHTRRAAVVPLDAGWTDVGSWAALWEIAEKDQRGNATSANVYLADTANSFVRAGERVVAVIGMNDVIVVDTADALLVVDRSHAEDVKEIVARLEANGSETVERHPEP